MTAQPPQPDGPARLIFLHGLHSSDQGYKARMLRQRFPQIHTPHMRGSLDERLAQIAPLLASASDWVIIGSSFGGLMGALWTCQHPQQVRRLVLLAPALTDTYLPDTTSLPPPVGVPTVAYHGIHDTVVPLEPARRLAEQLFTNIRFHSVDDDHHLRATVDGLDWPALLAG
jgi:pimeloyl-ACP methyl ester carboxylesterase